MKFLNKFKRNKQDNILPQEVQQYYQSEQRQRRGVAIALALLSLLAAIAIIIGLFLGGRWVYNKVRGNDAKQPVSTQQTDNNQNPGEINAPGSSNTNTGQNTPAPSPAPSNPPAGQNVTPNLGDENLPRTGDEGM